MPAVLAGDRAGRRALVDVRVDAAICRTCGTALDGLDPDEDPTGDDGEPICGNCYRERDFFVMDAADGVLDGQLGLSDDDHDDGSSD